MKRKRSECVGKVAVLGFGGCRLLGARGKQSASVCHHSSHLLDAYVPGTGLCYMPTVIGVLS